LFREVKQLKSDAMAELRSNSDIVTTFLLSTCPVRRWFDNRTLFALVVGADTPSEGVTDIVCIPCIPLTTGSAAEFYIRPMLSCVGDTDIMFHRNNQIAIPAGTSPPTQLPGEFCRCVQVFEIEESEFPGYVYLVLSYLLTERISDGEYNAVECHLRNYLDYKLFDKDHGPAFVFQWPTPDASELPLSSVAESHSIDHVFCVRCLSWPTQAADWPTRHRNYGWPDSATIDHVVINGCDVVRKAHHQSKGDYWKASHTQHRLSFSRAEIALMNSWIPAQQIMYHMLRVFVKIERLTENADNSDAVKLSNYHIKTLMLWACELKPRSWWTDDLNLIRIAVELLHTLAVWLSDVRCPHYFIHNCNLLTYPDDWCCSLMQVANRLMSETEASLTKWFIENYVRRCAQLCPDYVSRLFDDVSCSTKLQMAVSEVAEWRSYTFLLTTMSSKAQYMISYLVSRFSCSVHSCLVWTKYVITDHRLSVYLTAVIFLHVAYKTTRHPLTDELLDVLATTCLQSNDARRCLNARHNSVLSLSQATKLMKVVANNSHSTVQLIEIELSKAYLYRALRCKDSDSDSIYCLANVYLAVLYYITGQYQTAIDHCTLVTRSQGHSQCSSHVVQGELLPKIDDEIDNVLGLAVFYQYVRTAALNQQHQTQHVSVFTTELFAHYLHIRCLSITKCRQLTQTSSTDQVQRCQRYFDEFREMFITDVLLINFLNRMKYPTSDQRQVVVIGQTMSEISHQLDTSKLAELLQQSAIEHLTTFRGFEAQEFSSALETVTTDFEALYAYKLGNYQRCLQLCTRNVRKLIGKEGISSVLPFPEFIQLMDDDIVSLFGLASIVDPSYKDSFYSCSVHQLFLSLYLMAQCQMKLHQSLTSLAQTLNYVEVARRYILEVEEFVLDDLLLKLIERKILLYISRH